MMHDSHTSRESEIIARRRHSSMTPSTKKTNETTFKSVELLILIFFLTFLGATENRCLREALPHLKRSPSKCFEAMLLY